VPAPIGIASVGTAIDPESSILSMSPATSLYLDVIRFGAALTVFFAHYSSGRLSGGLFWQMQEYGHLAVIVFFVLSGLVIAYSADRKDRTLHAYCVSRFSRLYSVVVPAIVVTLAVDAVGIHVAPQLYTADWGFADSDPLLRVALALTFTSHIWFADFQIFSMGPFWSMPYEFWYYVLFGAIYYLPVRGRWLCAALAMLVAGPPILFLLPIWLMGIAAYYCMSRFRFSRWVGWLAFVFSVFVFVVCQYFHVGQHSLEFAQSFVPIDIIRRYCQASWTPYDYLVGTLVVVNIMAFQAIDTKFIRVLEWLKPTIRWVAGLTFSLYLLHMPLLQFYTAVSPWPAADWHHRVFLVVVTLGSVAVLGSITERRRAGLRNWLAKVIPDGRRWTIMDREGTAIGLPPEPALAKT
jgi:peptidoglycan/LPS O-acetylase OafA/YrhL